MGSDKETLLVVDDNPENIHIVKEVLGASFHIKAALNGKTALKVASKQLPDLILLDILMPEMDGYEVCKHLKQDKTTQDIPVIFITAKTAPQDIVKGFEVGAVDYVTKPFNAAELRLRVNTQLELRRTTRTLQKTNQQLSALTSKLSKYLSPQVYDSIFSGQRDVIIETFPKYLTVMFSDIVGFTCLSESMDRATLTKWLNTYLNDMANICLKYGGTLDKFVGDTVMVFFGDPNSNGPAEDAKQCVSMALDMLSRASVLGVNVRIGIHSGECNVGNFGSDSRMEYTVIGPNVNLASRLEDKADSNTVLISDTTYDHIKGAIPCSPHEDVRVKGIDRAIKTYMLKPQG